MFHKQLRKTHLYFWTLAIIIFVIGLLIIDQDDTLDINYHDTYYVVQSSLVNLLFTITYLLIGFIYWSFEKMDVELHPTLTNLHTFITIITVTLVLVIPEITSFFLEGFYYGVNTVLFVLSLITIFAQFIFVMNVLRGIILKLRRN